MATRPVLYTAPLCHLCDQARQVVYGVLPSAASIEEVDIHSDPALKDNYGLRIPVFAILDDRGQVIAEKGWPFTAGQLRRLVAGAADH
jgi:hypothetical protein